MEKITNDYKDRLTSKEAEYQKLAQKQDELQASNTALKQDVKRLEIEILDLKSMVSISEISVFKCIDSTPRMTGLSKRRFNTRIYSEKPRSNLKPRPDS